jgi:hypothetical protein
VIAAAESEGRLGLYAVVAGGHEGRLIRRLEGPAGMVPRSLSLSSGADPVVCATWGAPPQDAGEVASAELRCYRRGATRGRAVARDVQRVGVRADGRAVAWIDGQANSGLYVADLAGDVATVRTHERYVADAPATAGIPEGISEVDWIDTRTLALTDTGDSDEGKGLCVYVIGEPRAEDALGFGRCLHPGRKEKGFARFEEAAPVSAGVVVAVERPLWCCSDEDFPDPPSRAAHVRLADGAVVGVVATARKGRDLVDVSGGSRAVLYTTVGEGDPRVVSLRWADEAHGAPLTGLPADAYLVTAQP